jgi:hypothetical protein
MRVDASILVRQRHTQAARPLPKGFFPSFKDITHRFADVGSFQPTRSVGDFWQLARFYDLRLRNNYLIGIGVHDEISVVCDHDDLALGLGFQEQAHQLVENRFGVQVLFRLIDDQRPVIGVVECKIKQQQFDTGR